MKKLKNLLVTLVAVAMLAFALVFECLPTAGIVLIAVTLVSLGNVAYELAGYSLPSTIYAFQFLGVAWKFGLVAAVFVFVVFAVEHHGTGTQHFGELRRK